MTPLSAEQIDATNNLSAAANRIRAAFAKKRDTRDTMCHSIIELQHRIEAFLSGPGDPGLVLDAMKLVHKTFGAPGDWGYGTNRGDALSDFYSRSWSCWTKLFYPSGRCPACGKALCNDGSCCDACGWIKQAT